MAGDNGAGRRHGWYVLWAPTGFGNNTARLVEIWSAIRKQDPPSELYYPAYSDHWTPDDSILVPLFPTYAFVYCLWSIGLEDFIRSETGVYATFLRPVGGNEPRPLTDEQMGLIRQTLQERIEEARDWVRVGDLEIGDQVVILPHRLLGEILYFVPPCRAMVETVMFRQRTPVVVRVSNLEKL